MVNNYSMVNDYSITVGETGKCYEHQGWKSEELYEGDGPRIS